MATEVADVVAGIARVKMGLDPVAVEQWLQAFRGQVLEAQARAEALEGRVRELEGELEKALSVRREWEEKVLAVGDALVSAQAQAQRVLEEAGRKAEEAIAEARARADEVLREAAAQADQVTRGAADRVRALQSEEAEARLRLENALREIQQVADNLRLASQRLRAPQEVAVE